MNGKKTSSDIQADTLSDISSDRRSAGRPNQGKTGTIKQRKFDVYLPTTELLQEWRETAEASGMSLSRYIMEVVEQHRQGIQLVTMPSPMLEERANQLEKELAALQMRFDTLNLAFHNQEVELSRLSIANTNVGKGYIDLPTVKSMVNVLRNDHKQGIDWLDMLKVMHVTRRNSEQMKKWADALNFLMDVGLVNKGLDDLFRWNDER
jgi:hypothetical protein